MQTAQKPHSDSTEPHKKAHKVRGVRTRITFQEWDIVKRRYILGESSVDLAESTGIKAGTIMARAHREKWRKGTPMERKTGVSGSAAPLAPDSENPLCRITVTQGIPDSQDQTPEEFQAAVSKHAKALMALGLQNIQPPKSISEAATLNALIRKADGLDSQNSSPINIGIINPIRSLSRIIPNRQDRASLTIETDSQQTAED